MIVPTIDPDKAPRVGCFQQVGSHVIHAFSSSLVVAIELIVCNQRARESLCWSAKMKGAGSLLTLYSSQSHTLLPALSREPAWKVPMGIHVI